jgi:hypothetical protein
MGEPLRIAAASMPATGWCRARSPQATKKRGRPNRALEQDRFGFGHLPLSKRVARSVNPALFLEFRVRFTFLWTPKCFHHERSHSGGRREANPQFQLTRWPSVAGAVTPAAQPLQVGSSNSHPYPSVRPVPRTEIAFAKSAWGHHVQETGGARFRAQGCKARPSGCRSSVRSRRSRLGPHRWIGAEPPQSSASTKAALATTEEWQLSGETEARPANRRVCGR